MVKFFNGTSAEAFFSIKEDGFCAPSNGIWTCSDTTKVYLSSYDYTAYNSDEREEYKGEIHEQLLDAFRLSVENAQITAAVTGSNYNYVVVFEFEMPDDVVDDFVTEDDSCENMCNCYEIDEDDLNRLIKEGKVTVKTHQICNGYKSFARSLYLPSNSDWLDYEQIPADVVKLAKVLGQCEDAICLACDELIGAYDDDLVADGFDLADEYWQPEIDNYRP